MNLNQIYTYFGENINMLLLYLPLGIIGVWRWLVWLIRKFISLFYKMPKGNYQSSLSIVVPIYNENPIIFEKALRSWAGNGVEEIVAVIDYMDEKNIAFFKNFQNHFPGGKLIITRRPGKREALADGIRATGSPIVALVDSDTFWEPNIKNKILAPFSDPKVGGLVTRQDVFRTKTLAQKIFKILLDDRYLFEYPFLATVSDAMLCLSGRTAVYRKSAIINKLDKLENDTFLGKKMISGDDKTLTRLIHEDGWKSRYLKEVRVYTSGMPKMRNFLKQKLRWARNGLRSDSKALFSRWLWKRHKILALHMLDKFISPLTLLLSPVFLAVSIALGHYYVSLLIVAWWIVSRGVKIFPHLREKPGDIFILPIYILMTFVMALVKLYALITVDEQGWITRWDKKRLVDYGLFSRLVSYSATGALVFFMFFGVFSYKNRVLKASILEKKQFQDLKMAEEEDRLNFFTNNLPRPSEKEILDIKTTLLEKNRGDAFGYYSVKSGDTLSSLRKRFNLLPTARILDADSKIPLANFSFLRIGQQLAIPAADLQNPLDKNILSQSSFGKPTRVTYEPASNTIYLRQGGSVTNLSRIRNSLLPAYRKYLEPQTSGEWILRANLYVGKNVTLVLDGTEIKHLKLSSNPGSLVWIRSESGNILISNTKITSWDEMSNTPDINDLDGRSYITAKNSGRMDVINSEIAYLGYVGFPKRGGLFGGSYGISWKIKNGGFRDSLLTGVVSGSRFHHNYFGLYTYGVSGMIIRNNEAYENIQYGFDPHDDSNNMLIENNRAYRNGNHGIIISRRCFNNSLFGNVSFDNRLHGIMLDRQSNNNLVKNNVVYGNVDGIAIYESSSNLILENEIKNNVRGIRANEKSIGNYIEGNSIFENDRGIYFYGQTEKNLAFKNSLKNNAIGITLKDASDNSFFENLKIGDNKKNARITAEASGNNIQ